MTIQEVLAQMRDPRYVLRDPNVWADAIEAAMREPVAENRPVTIPGMPSPTYYEIRWLPGKHLPPGTKLYALPSHAAMEIQRLTERVASAADGLRERDRVLSRLRRVRMAAIRYLNHSDSGAYRDSAELRPGSSPAGEDLRAALTPDPAA